MLKKRNNPNILTTPYHYSAQWSGDKQAEFSVGRFCAAKAIEALTGRYPVSVDQNQDRSPHWPDGVVGSITHTDNFVSAAVAYATDFISLGIDSEKIINERIIDETKRIALLRDEHDFMLRLPFSAAQIVTLIFSAKESVYKCVSPLVKYPFDFSDIDIVSVDVQNHKFNFRLPPSMDQLLQLNDRTNARFQFEPGCVHTAVEISSSILRPTRG